MKRRNLRPHPLTFAIRVALYERDPMVFVVLSLRAQVERETAESKTRGATT